MTIAWEYLFGSNELLLPFCVCFFSTVIIMMHSIMVFYKRQREFNIQVKAYIR